MNTADRPINETENDPAASTHSKMSGRAGDVVQARDVSGGVHFYRPGPRVGPIPRQLPADARVFVNRRADLQQLDNALTNSHSICVIVGTAGVGKTSLAVHWAHRVREQFADGQLYVNLRGYDPGIPVTAEQALDRFLRALDVSAGAIPKDLEERAALYRSLLADRRMLVLLDNAANTGQVRPLLPGTDSCLVLVTSRSRLSSLMAREGALRLTLDVLAEPEAIELLRTTINGYRHNDSLADIAELARLCARLPLALRIAAERASSRPQTPLSDLIQDLRDESALWDLLSSDDDEEASAVRTVFAWSYRALSSDAARFFRLLGLHPGPDFSWLAAAALTGVTNSKARQLLDALVGAHLLEQVDRDRFQFHDLLRAYAADQVHSEESLDDQRAALRRSITWYLHSADAAVTASMYDNRRFPLNEPAKGVSPAEFSSHATALDWYELERSNLVAATVSANNAGMYDLAWQLPGVLRSFYNFRHPFDDWFTTGRIGIDAARRVGDKLGVATILYSLGKAHTQYQQLRQGLECFDQALRIQRAIGDRLGEAESLRGAGIAHLRLRQLLDAKQAFAQSRAIASDLHEVHHEASALHSLGTVCIELDELEDAVRYLEQAVAILRDAGNQPAEIDALVPLCEALRELHRTGEAHQVIQRALKIAADTDDRIITALSLIELGKLQITQKAYDEALKSFQRATVLQRALGNRAREAHALDNTGEAYQRLGRPHDAAAFHRQAITIQRTLNDTWWLATALDNLAIALESCGEEQEARQHWQEAMTILAEYSDPRSRRHYRSIQQKLSGERPEPAVGQAVD